MTRRYFDWAATGLPDASLLSRCLNESLRSPANPSALHADGRAAREVLETCRERCAVALGVPARTVVFTSGGTESNNIALQSTLLSRARRGLVVSAIEHPSVAESSRRLSRLGVALTSVKPERDGRVASETLARAVSRAEDAALVAVMAVNNETGAAQDIPALVAAAREAAGKHRVRFHCDAVQAIGKVPFDLARSDADSASFSAHKLGGPRGVGLLYARKSFESPYSGGSQEFGLRPGTENVFGALALAELLETRAMPASVAAAFAAAEKRMARLIASLRRVPGCVLVPADRADADARFSPYILQAAFAGVPGEAMVRVLDDEGVSISTGSACSSADAKRPVLEAMGIDGATAFGAVRFSQGDATSDEDMDGLIAAIGRALRSFR